MRPYSFISYLPGILVFLLFMFSCNKEVFKEIEPVNAEPDFSRINQPNIILILADDVGYEVPNYTGGKSYNTPYINLMAANGLQLSQVYSCPLCSPSRVEILTGKYNNRNYTRWGTLEKSNYTIANVLKDEGYATCVVGKWQLDGGDSSIKKFGFQKYSVWNPYNPDLNPPQIAKVGSHYKDPIVYENGAYLPYSKTKGQYGEDMYQNYLFNFIDSNKTKPFFAYWALNLCHLPFCPTPESPEFKSWVVRGEEPGDTIYFPGMVHYMDKLIGRLINKLNSVGLAENTFIIFTTDNGTPTTINSNWRGQQIAGGKGETTTWGTHAPTIVYCPAKVKPGVDNSLIDFSDFLPTIARLGNTKPPPYLGIIDGISFMPQLFGDPQASKREWSYCYFSPRKERAFDDRLTRWVQTNEYKYYDSSRKNPERSNMMFNFFVDPYEKDPLKELNETEAEMQEKFKHILDSLK